jgi:hypothetical protein
MPHGTREKPGIAMLPLMDDADLAEQALAS